MTAPNQLRVESLLGLVASDFSYNAAAQEQVDRLASFPDSSALADEHRFPASLLPGNEYRLDVVGGSRRDGPGSMGRGCKRPRDEVTRGLNRTIGPAMTVPGGRAVAA